MFIGLLFAVVVLGLIGVSIFDLAFRPTIRKLALRNIVRRRSEAMLVVVGSLLGTAIITASFIMGGTVGASIRDFARTQLGPTDEVVSVPQLSQLDALERTVSSPPIDGTDGALRAVTAPAAVATTTTPKRAEPRSGLVEVDFDKARAFGGSTHATGFANAGATPRPGEIVVGQRLAEKLKLKTGDTVEVYVYGQQKDLRVTGIVPELGVAGFGEGVRNAFVAPGTIGSLYQTSKAANAVAPGALMLVSNKGGVFSGAKLTDTIVPRLRDRVSGVAGADVRDSKKQLLHNGDVQGKNFVQLFGGIGAFSVIAGILLLVNIFVMLSEERKSELGMLRAVGLKRNQLVRTFGLEGGIYAATSAVVGSVVGIGIGRVIVFVAQSLFSRDSDRFGSLTLRFTVTPGAAIGGMLLGGLISFLTVWGTSARIGRLNVIQAIRDLQDQTLRRVRARTLILAGVGVLIGASLFLNGVRQDAWFGALAGIPIASFSAIPLLSRIAPRRAVVTACSAVPLVWAIACFTLLPRAFDNVDIPGFVVQGVILVAAAVTLISTNADILAKSTSVLSMSGRTLAARLALAYPLARRFRTSMLLGMYAIVIFTITFIAVFSNLFQQQTPKFVREEGAGYQLLVDSNRANPVPASVLASQPGVTAVAPLLRAFTDFSADFHPARLGFVCSGFDQRLLARGVPKLSDFQARYGNQRAAWEAVLGSNNLAVVSDFFLQEEGGPPRQRIRPGATFTMYNRTTGEQREMTVAGVIGTDIGAFNGMLMSGPAMSQFLGHDAVPSRFYVAVNGNADDTATKLQGTLLANGVQADSFHSLITKQAQQQQGFFHLMEGYLGLGLVIGIAGLGVVMVRAVRERRRQIGMLRAMGFQHRVVRTAFLLEATFIALQGIVIGVGLALVTSYSLLTKSDSFGSQRLNFVVPWLALLGVVVVAMIASLAAVFGPATSASRIKPAVALRIAD